MHMNFQWSDFEAFTFFLVMSVSPSICAKLRLLSGFTCLIELEEFLFEPIPLGLLTVSPEPLHLVSAPAWSLRAH